MNAEVFQTSEHQPLLLHEATHQRMLKRLPKHKWAFPNWGRIPTAYVLPKRKKEFATGRPIVSFAQAQGRVLWESFADVLSLMVRQTCPDSFGEGSGVNQLHLIKQHSAESWLWHWAVEDVSHVPLIEMAEQWEGTGQWDAAQWLVHWVESVDIGSGFDAGSPSPTFAPDTGPYDGQPVAADSGLGTGQAEASSSAQPLPVRRGVPTFSKTGIAALAASSGRVLLLDRGGKAVPQQPSWLNQWPIGLSTGSPRMPERMCAV